MSLVRAPRESVHDQVRARMLIFSSNRVAEGFLEALGNNSFKAAPLLSPPIPTGMTDVTNKLEACLIKRPGCATSQEEYRKVPDLVRRIRHLLRVYYDAKVTGRKSVEFKYCDMQDISEVATCLHECGLSLQLNPGRLRALFRYAPSMDEFLFEEPLDVGRWSTESFSSGEAVAQDAESSGDDFMAAFGLEDKASKDSAARFMAYFVGDLLVGWVLITALDNDEKRRTERATKRLVEYGASPIYWKTQVLGDAITEATQSMYGSPEALLRFSLAGGLPMLFSEWAVAVAGHPGGYINSTIESLPAKAWEGQTDETLLGVMEGIVKKVDNDEDNKIVTGKVLAKIIHRIFLLYGIGPFQRASNISASCILFFFLHRRIARKPSVYKSYSETHALLKRYPHLVETTRRRHGWLILNITNR